MKADYRVFFLDHDEKFTAAMIADANLLGQSLIVASDDRELMKTLLDPACHIAAAFINVMVPGSNSLHAIKLFQQYRPGTPVVVLYDEEKPIGTQDLHRLGVHSIQKKGESYAEMIRSLGSEIFEYRGLVHERTQWTSPKGDPYYAVPAADFLTGTKAIFDVYLKLPAGKVIKILEANDKFSPSRVLGYLKNGATSFLLKKEFQQRCMTSVDSFSRHLVHSLDASPALKMTSTLNYGQGILGQVKQEGLTVATLESGGDFVDKIFQIISNSASQDGQFISEYMTNIPAFEHAIATTFIASLLAAPLEITNAAIFNTIGVASMLQDLGLYRMPEVVQRKDLSQMNVAQKAQYRTHPTVGADILSKMEDIEEVIVQAVAQHHERRDSSGFPQGHVSSSGGINRVAEIIGISDEYVSLLKNKLLTKTEIEITLTEKVFPGFSLPIVEAFAKTFLN